MGEVKQDERDFNVVDKRFWRQEKKEGELKEEKKAPTYVEELKKEIREKEKLLNDCRAAYKGKATEYESFKKRLEKDFEKKTEQKYQEVVKNFLPVVDALEKALNSSQDNINDFASFRQGISLIYELFLEQLKKMGVEERESSGKKFAPEWQEALEVIDTDKQEDDNKVVEELEKGYFINNKVIRPAKVRVSVYKRVLQNS